MEPVTPSSSPAGAPPEPPQATPPRPWRRRLILLLAVALALGGINAWAWYQLRAGRRELEAFHARAAVVHLRKCARIWPWSRSARLLMARAQRLDGNFAAAEMQLLQCQAGADAPGDDLLEEWAMLQASAGDVSLVEAYLRKRIDRHHPDTPAIFEALATGYLRMYRLQTAFGCLNEWLERNPDCPQALYLRGRLWHQVHSYRQAADDFTAVLEREPARDDARLRLAAALLKLNRAADAANHLERLHSGSGDTHEFGEGIPPIPPESDVLLARAWKALGRREEAIELLDAVLDRAPAYGPALSTRGELALDAGELDKAARLLRAAAAADPADHPTQFLLYRCLEAQGEHEQAAAQKTHLDHLEKDLLRLIEISQREMSSRPKAPELHHEIATIMARLGNVPMARSWYLSALRVDPNFVPAQEALRQLPPE